MQQCGSGGKAWRRAQRCWVICRRWTFLVRMMPLSILGLYGPVCLGYLKMQPTRAADRWRGFPRCYQTACESVKPPKQCSRCWPRNFIHVHCRCIFAYHLVYSTFYLDPRWRSPGVWWCGSQNAAWAETTEAWRIVRVLPYFLMYYIIIRTCVCNHWSLYVSMRISSTGENCHRVCK